MIHRKVDRSWIITWSFCILSAIVASFFMGVEARADTITFQETDAAFRIVDIRSEQGQLAIEVQHFNPDGSHWFYEMYNWEGREEYNHPRVTNEQGEFLLEDNTVALYKETLNGESVQYIPYSTITFEKIAYRDYRVVSGDFQLGFSKQDVNDTLGEPDIESDLVWKYRIGSDWKRHAHPFLTESLILDTILNTHKVRSETGWRGNLGRVILPKLQFNSVDQQGSQILVSRFQYLVEEVYNFDGSEYLGDLNSIATVEDYFERVDLRTQDTKTYQIDSNTFKTEVSTNTHYQTTEGQWLESSLNFRKSQAGWVMDTHPSYTVLGTESTLSMMSLDEDIGARWYTPSPLTYKGSTATYTYGGLDWIYTLTGKGIKLTSEVINTQGPTSYNFVFLPLGNASGLSIDSNGNAVSGNIEGGEYLDESVFFYYNTGEKPEIVVPKAIIVGANEERYLGGDWEIVDDYTIKFDFDDSNLPLEAFPYIIDPTTILQNAGVGTKDSQILSNDPTGNWYDSTTLTIGDNDSGASMSARALFKFDLSSIPNDALVTDTIFSIKVFGGASGGAGQTNMYRLNQDWVETAVSWNDYKNVTAWSTAGAGHVPNDRDADISATVNVTDAPGWFDFSGGQLINDVQRMVKGQYDNYGWILHPGNEYSGSDPQSQFYSSNYTGVLTDRPKLSITYSYNSVFACPSSTATFHPDAHTESSSVDGRVDMTGGGEASWATKRPSAGGGHDDTPVTEEANIQQGSSAGLWEAWSRIIFLFDTSSLPDDAIVTKAEIRLISDFKDNDLGLSAVIVQSSPASNTALANGDFDSFTGLPGAMEKQSDPVTLASINTDGITPTIFVLNATGRDNISTTDVTKFGLVSSADADNSEPGFAGVSHRAYIRFYAAEETVAGYRRPKLTVEYASPCIGLTGTVSDSTISTFYPDGSSIDGGTYDNSPSTSWFAKRDGAGDGVAATAAVERQPAISATASTDQYSVLGRAILGFNTAALPNYSTACTVNQTATLYPDAAASGQSYDGYTARASASAWNAIRSGASTAGSNTYGYNVIQVQYDASPGTFATIYRSVATFETADIPDTAIVTGGHISVVGSTSPAMTDQFSGGDTAVWSINDSSSNLVVGAVGDTAYLGHTGSLVATDEVLLASMTIDNSTYTEFQLNTRGVEEIQSNLGAGKVSEFTFLHGRDFFDREPSGGSGGHKSSLYTFSADEASTTKDPRLVVFYDLPCPGIHSAELGLVLTFAADDFDDTVVVTTSSPASNTALTATDFTSHGSVQLSVQRPITSLTVDSSTFNTWGFNTRGLAHINDVGNTNLGLRLGLDIDNIEPPWISDGRDNIEFATSEEVLGGDKRPRLVISHGDTSTPHIDGSDIVTGGKTIILTLNGSTWVASGGTFDAQRQNIIDGLTGSHGGGSVNWNVAVSDDMAVTEVVRTSATVVTITLAAHAAYAPATAETITATIPASALVDGAGAITSNPIFTIDPISFLFNSFTPTAAPNTGSFSMTIAGLGLPTHGFSGSEDVRLIKSGQSDIVCTSVSGGSGTSVVVSCPINSAVVGAWDVKVTEAGGLNTTKLGALNIFQPWSSTVNGGSFSDSGSDYAVFAHTASPYFTVQAFDEVDKEWDAASAVPATLPSAAGLDAQIVSSYVGKDRIVVGTASASPALFAYEFNPSTGVISDTPDNPASGAISMDINALDIGYYDNIVVLVTNGGDYVYMYDIDPGAAIASFWTNEITVNPATLPGAECNAVDINHNATYVAIGCTTSPYLHVWAITNGAAGTPSWGSKVADASSLPSGAVNGVKFSADGTQIAVAIASSPYVEVYEFNGGTVGDKASNPSTLPTGIGYDVAWLAENTTGITNLAVAHATTPFVSVYSFTTNASAAGTFGAKIANPSTLPTGTPSSVGFHPNDDTIFVGHATAPFVTAYNFTGVSDDDYRTYRYMANFDTSYLPDDAVVTTAVLSLYIDSKNAATTWNLSVQDGVTGSEPLVVGDYDYLKYVGGSLGSLASGSMTTGAYNNITLGSTGAISDTGITQFILRHDEDRTGVPPTGVETVDIEVGGSGTFPTACKTSTTFATQYANSDYNLCNSVNVPKLTLTYTSASAPSTTSVSWTNAQEAALTPDGDGIYTIEVLAKGPILGLRNGTVESVTYNKDIVNNSNDWYFWTSSSPADPFPYSEYLKYDVDDTQQLWYQLNEPPTYRFEDRSGNANHSTSMSFPIADSISVSLESVETTGDLPVPDISTVDQPSLLGDITNLGNNAGGDSLFVYGEPVNTPTWMTELFGNTSAKMGLEDDVLVAVMLLFVSVILGLGAYLATGNPMLTIVGAGIGIFAGVTLGVLGIWTIIVFVLVGVATVGISRSV